MGDEGSPNQQVSQSKNGRPAMVAAAVVVVAILMVVFLGHLTGTGPRRSRPTTATSNVGPRDPNGYQYTHLDQCPLDVEAGHVMQRLTGIGDRAPGLGHCVEVSWLRATAGQVTSTGFANYGDPNRSVLVVVHMLNQSNQPQYVTDSDWSLQADDGTPSSPESGITDLSGKSLQTFQDKNLASDEAYSGTLAFSVTPGHYRLIWQPHRDSNLRGIWSITVPSQDSAATVTTAESQPPSTTPPTTAAPFGAPATVSEVAQARGATVAVYDAPSGRVTNTLQSPTQEGAPLVFLVLRQQPRWLQVELPTPPNDSSGWIKATDVSLTQDQYRIDISLSQHEIIVMNGASIVLDEPAATCSSDSSAVGSTFYIKALLQPGDPNGPFGPDAYALSAYTNTLNGDHTGPATIGIHGTNRPDLLGHDVPTGCISVSNTGMSTLATHLPLGVPVRILP